MNDFHPIRQIGKRHQNGVAKTRLISAETRHSHHETQTPLSSVGQSIMGGNIITTDDGGQGTQQTNFLH